MYKPLQLKLKDITTHKSTEYSFQQNRPILIVGENLDDPSQRGNGSGKSGLMDAIAIALTGSPVRNASNKEIVRRGCESGEVELTLHNTLSNCELKIWRKLYSTTKSAEVKVWENGEQRIASDVNEYNKLIFSRLDISKEDLFSFYLLTKSTYEPFFSIGDTKKKAIINRFSGADKVDLAIPAIDEDVSAEKAVKAAIEQSIAVCKGKQEVLCDQIAKEKQRYSEEYKQQQLEHKQSLLDEHFSSVDRVAGELEQAEIELAEAEKELQHFEKAVLPKGNWEAKIEAEEAILESIEVELESLKAAMSLVKHKFTDEIEAIKQEEAQNNQLIVENKEVLTEANKAISSLESQLAGVIACPKCQHKFSLRDETFSYDEAVMKLTEWTLLKEECEKELKQCQDVAADIDVKKSNVNAKVIEAQTELKLSISTLQNSSIQQADVIKGLKEKRREEQLEHSSLKGRVELAKRGVTSKELSLEELLKQAERMKAEIEAIRTGESEQLESLEQQLLGYCDEEAELHEKLNQSVAKLQGIEEWYTNFKNFKSYLANQSIKNIQDYTNLYLEKMGSNLSVSIEGYRMLSNKKLKEEISISVLRDGVVEGSYGTFSGGERGRLDIAVILAIQSLINLNASSGGIDLLMIDEVMDSIDDLGLECIVNGLKSVQRTVLMVSQVSVNSLKENTLIIRKQNKISQIV